MSTAVATKPAKVSPKTSTNVKNAVGINGDNQKRHVLLIQNLLNRNLHLLPKTYPLVENGLNIKATEQVILSFQATVVKKGPIDGRVDINGNTYKLLLKNARRKRPGNVIKFINFVIKDAKKVSKKYKIPVSIVIAQSGHEIGWNLKPKGNAFYGEKSHNSTGPSVTFTTHEVIKGKRIKIKDKFKAFSSYAAAADGYGRFLTLNKRYKGCFAFYKKPYKFADAVAAAPYATDPKYAQKLKRLLKLFYLTDYDRTGP